MTGQEKAELNRRVAVALGWTVVQNPNSLWGFVLKSQQGKMDFVRTKDTEEQAWAMIPLFGTDPAAADLVRQEIERRGWVWSIGPWEGKRYSSWVTGGTARCATAPHGLGESDSPWEALCLAFLAAHDAEEEQKP